jgi:alpha-amylase
MIYIRKIVAMIAAFILISGGLLSCDNWMVDSLLKKKEEQKVPVRSVHIDGGTERVSAVGRVLMFSASVEPQNASNKDLIWESDRPDIAEVGRYNGTVALLREGEAAITVKTIDGGYTDICRIRVTKNVDVSGLNLDKESIEGFVSDDTEIVVIIINASVEPPDATDKEIIWTSSDKGVAIVRYGAVALVGQGTAIITASSAENENISKTCTVTVKPK